MPDNALAHDLERTGDDWMALLLAGSSLPVLERAYRAVTVLLLTGGLKGLAGVRTAQVAQHAMVDESTLYRYINKRDQLVADAVDWCWQKVNDRIAIVHHRTARSGQTAAELIMIDLDTFLDQFDEPETRLHGTGALLSYRRAENLIGDHEPSEQLLFRNRLSSLCAGLLSECDADSIDAGTLANYLINYISTVWFTWLADPKVQDRNDRGLLGREMVHYHLTTTLRSLRSCDTPGITASAAERSDA